MAAKLSERQIQTIEDRGIFMLSPKEGLRRLFRNFQSNAGNLIICEFDWQRYLGSLAIQRLYFDKFSVEGVTEQTALIDLVSLENANQAERRSAISMLVRGSIARLLQFEDVEDIIAEARFADLGLDSLVAVELINSIEAALGTKLMSSLVYDYPTIPLLTEFLTDSIWQPEVLKQDHDKVGIEELSDDELERELIELTS